MKKIFIKYTYYVIIDKGDIMVYLDYSATTPVNKDVLNSFSTCCLNYPGNPNSLHKLGVEANNLIKDATEQIAALLNVKSSEIIYTSGSSEANNTAIKGIALKYQNRGKHIITTSLEHSSIYGPIDYLVEQGFKVSFVELDDKGKVSMDSLKSLMTDETILVSINMVNSELGIEQDIAKIGEFLKEYPKCFFHVDMTQAVGKIKINLDNVDLASFSAHKMFGIKGVGVLVKKEKVELLPLIHGGKSTTIYRSGTPALPLIVSQAKALRLALTDLDKKYDHVLNLNKYLKENLVCYDKVRINSNEYSIPHILNISVLGVKPETMLHALETYEIFISTQSACSSSTTLSKAVLNVTKDKEIASSSIRISISALTTKEEIDYFLAKFKICYENLEKLSR